MRSEIRNFTLAAAVSVALLCVAASPVVNRAVVAGRKFSPAQLPGLQLWLKPDSLSLADNAEVETWPDSSGNGRDAVQATSTKRPLFKTNFRNGNGVLKFDGSDDFLAPPAASYSVQTIIAVFHRLALHSYDGVITARVSPNSTLVPASDIDGGFGGSGLAVDKLRSTAASGTHSFVSVDGVSVSANSFDTSSDITATAGQWHVITTVRTTASAAGAKNWAIGADVLNTSRTWDGYIAEIIIYNTALPAADRQKVERYLGAKYAITVP
jgi:hypothetical protein